MRHERGQRDGSRWATLTRPAEAGLLLQELLPSNMQSSDRQEPVG